MMYHPPLGPYPIGLSPRYKGRDPERFVTAWGGYNPSERHPRSVSGSGSRPPGGRPARPCDQIAPPAFM